MKWFMSIPDLKEKTCCLGERLVILLLAEFLRVSQVFTLLFSLFLSFFKNLTLEGISRRGEADL